MQNVVSIYRGLYRQPIPIQTFYLWKSNNFFYWCEITTDGALLSLCRDLWSHQLFAERVSLTGARGATESHDGTTTEQGRRRGKVWSARCERSSVCKDMSLPWWKGCKLPASERQGGTHWSHNTSTDPIPIPAMVLILLIFGSIHPPLENGSPGT